METSLSDLEAFKVPQKPDNYDILFGLPIPPIDRLRTFSADQFEDMICEWADGYLKKSIFLYIAQVRQVIRAGI